MQVGTTKINPGKTGQGKVDREEMSTTQTDTCETGSLQVAPGQIRASKVNPDDLGLSQADPAKLDADHDRIRHFGCFENGLTQREPGQEFLRIHQDLQHPFFFTAHCLLPAARCRLPTHPRPSGTTARPTPDRDEPGTRLDEMRPTRAPAEA